MSLSASERAHAARETGVLAALRGGAGMADPGLLRIEGPDAASFLHSQTTNDVEGLKVGDGQLSARVSRTGHLVQLFSLHRLAEQTFVAVLPRDQVPALLQALDDFLFADRVTLTDASQGWQWLTLQGPKAVEVATLAFGHLGFEPWESLPDGAIRQVRRMHSRWGAEVPEGTLAIRRSLTGDRGFLIGLPADAPEVVRALRVAAVESGLESLEDDVDDVLDILRIEAGLVRLPADMPGKPRLLPETGLERDTVSYTKGCYLGQEVIARVRTYGSVPYALRALVLQGPPEALDAVPPVGSEVMLPDRQRPIGELLSRAYSPLLEAPVVLAYLDRDHRTPGTVLDLPWGSVKVATLPLYQVPDAAARVAFLYDRAIRIFAEGREDDALEVLEQCLRLNPSFADGYEAIGIILGRAGRYHEAIDFFRRLEEVAPDEPLVNTNLSLYYMKIGDKTTAEAESAKVVQKQFSRASQKEGTTVADVAQEQAAARRKDAERKKRMFAQVLDFDPVDPIALFGMGSALATLQSWAEAVEFFARGVDVDKNNSALYLSWGKALEALERTDEALDVYKRGMDVASRRGDLMPLKEMEHRVLLLQATAG